MEITCAALLLDADGTLVDSTAAVERTWRVWATEYGVDAEAVLRVCHGRRSEETIARFVPAEEVERAVTRLDELELIDLDDVASCPGAAELLAGLDGADCMPWAIVTSGIVPLVTARMKAAGLRLPDVLVTAEAVATGKPDPEGYRLAAQRLGVTAERCVVVEDAPAGIRAGRAAGATVVAVTTPSYRRRDRPCRQVPDDGDSHSWRAPCRFRADLGKRGPAPSCPLVRVQPK